MLDMYARSCADWELKETEILMLQRNTRCSGEKKGEDEDSDVEERFRATGHQKFEFLAVDLPSAFFFIDVVEC